MTWWMLGLPVAAAGASQGELFGKPFTVATAIAVTDPAQPGMLSVLLTGTPLTCDAARALRSGGAGGKKPKAPPVMVVVAFSDVKAGAPASSVMILGPKGMGALAGTVTLASVPAGVGQKGALQVSLAADPKAKEGMMGGIVASADTDRLSGEVPFELCDALQERPSLAGTVFATTRVHVEEKSVFPDSPPNVMDVQMAMPTGWIAGTNPIGSPMWTAPDGQTRLTLALESPSDPFEASLQLRTQDQVKAFQTEGTTGEMVNARLAAEGAFVARWRYRWGEGPWSNTLDVFRQGAGWPHTVKCTIEGTDTAVAEVFDAAEAACVGLVHAP